MVLCGQSQTEKMIKNPATFYVHHLWKRFLTDNYDHKW